MAKPTEASQWQFALRTLFVLMFVACVILAVVSLYPGSIRSKLDLVTPGMTEAQVLEILGRPFNEHHFPDGRSYWAYPDGFHDPWLIYFDENREVVEVR